MRTLPILLVSLCSSIAYAGGGRAETSEEAKTLTASEVQTYLAPYRSEIRGCFLASAPGGALELQMIIHRDGSVFQLAVVTHGLPRRAAGRIERCIKGVATAWHFPVRRGFTHVTVPFRFVKTVAPGAGPQRTCWRRRGCRV